MITAVNNTSVHQASDLAQALAAHDPGQKVEIAMTTTQGATRTVTVTLGQLPGS
jgi:S1-C subfamily serine protease